MTATVVALNEIAPFKVKHRVKSRQTILSSDNSCKYFGS